MFSFQEKEEMRYVKHRVLSEMTVDRQTAQQKLEAQHNNAITCLHNEVNALKEPPLLIQRQRWNGCYAKVFHLVAQGLILRMESHSFD